MEAGYQCGSYFIYDQKGSTQQNEEKKVPHQKIKHGSPDPGQRLPAPASEKA